MPIYIYNSLTRKKEEFTPLKPPKVNIYTCGVTVYDESHIGHARSLYIFDVLRKYLAWRGFRVRFVRNITDIDDKIINRSKELQVNWKDLVKKYIASYNADLNTLGIRRGDVEPRATENIASMIKYIQKLIDKEHAYVAGGDVYFNVRRFVSYGKLSGQSIDQMNSGARIEPTELKKDPLDFALWKSSKEGEPSWKSPWGQGRPGWHIECSVMSQKFLNTETLDIHAGGRDLIFPHHENEVAQAEALTGKPFAKYWVHHGLLTIEGQKMAKSLGNFITIKDFVAKFSDADILKLFFLSAHYSHPIDYSLDKIEECRKQRKSFDNFFDRVNNWRLLRKAPMVKSWAIEKAKIDAVCVAFREAMDDDLNTPQGLAHLFELIDLASGYVSLDKKEAFGYARSKVEAFFKILGLRIRLKKNMPKDILKLAVERDLAKQNKDFRKADRIREEIKSEFRYELLDTHGGITFIEI